MNFKTTALTLFLIIFISHISGQNTFANRLNINRGLSNNYIHTIDQDKKGFIWIGTETGLDSYDGNQIRNYAKRLKTPLKGAVQCVYEWEDRQLLIATSWGAFSYNIRTNEIRNFDFHEEAVDVRQIVRTSDGQFYFVTNRGIFGADKELHKLVKLHIPHTENLHLKGIEASRNKGLFLVADHQIFHMEGTSASALNVSLPASVISSLLVGNRLFLGTTNGLYSVDISKSPLLRYESLANISITSLAGTEKNQLYVGTQNNGIFSLDIRTGHCSEFLNQSNGLISNSITSLMVDSNQNLWIGTLDGGVDYYNLNNQPKFTSNEILGKGSTHLRSIYIDSDGTRYGGTRDGRFFSFTKNNKVLNIVSLAGVCKSQIITTIHPHPTRPDYLLMGTFGGGVMLINKHTLKVQQFSQDPRLKETTAYKFCTDDTKQIWMATLDGLIKYNPINSTYTTFLPATRSNEVFSMALDRHQNVWLGTKTGICVFQPSNQRFTTTTELNKYKFQCTSIYIDSHQNIWACFNKGGVLKLAPDGKKTLLWATKEMGLPENAPSSVVEDLHHQIWIGSSKGLFKIDRKNNIETYGLEDGLTGVSFIPESANRDNEGKLWWANEKGLVHFRSTDNAPDSKPLTISLTDIAINGTRLDADTLAFVKKTSSYAYTVFIKGKANNNIDLQFAVPGYKYPLKYKFNYIFESEGNVRSVTTAENTISLPSLALGNHIIRVKSTNNQGQWTDKELIVQLNISPYFYETYWFVAMLVMLAIALIVYLTRGYIRRMRDRWKIQLEELHSKQTKQIETPALKIPLMRAEDIKRALNEYMIADKPFLSSELRQADVAKATGYPVHEISQVLNVVLNMNFPDYVNSFRVDEIKERMKTDDAKKYTLTAIAMQCGFSGKSSFLRAFKKVTGQTPSEYFKGTGIE